MERRISVGPSRSGRRFRFSRAVFHDTIHAQKMPTDRVFDIGQVVSGRYRVTRYLARGGMGEVYAADDLDLREPVALKTLRPEIAANARSVNRFKQEIQLSRKIAHPNVCRVYMSTTGAPCRWPWAF